jgi:hypothetical protein
MISYFLCRRLLRYCARRAFNALVAAFIAWSQHHPSTQRSLGETQLLIWVYPRPGPHTVALDMQLLGSDKDYQRALLLWWESERGTPMALIEEGDDVRFQFGSRQ